MAAAEAGAAVTLKDGDDGTFGASVRIRAVVDLFGLRLRLPEEEQHSNGEFRPRRDPQHVVQAALRLRDPPAQDAAREDQAHGQRAPVPLPVVQPEQFLVADEVAVAGRQHDRGQLGEAEHAADDELPAGLDCQQPDATELLEQRVHRLALRRRHLARHGDHLAVHQARGDGDEGGLRREAARHGPTHEPAVAHAPHAAREDGAADEEAQDAGQRAQPVERVVGGAELRDADGQEHGVAGLHGQEGRPGAVGGRVRQAGHEAAGEQGEVGVGGVQRLEQAAA